ncbi:hypothetical protein [Shewanella aestuarii]|uniref:Transporter substrate-binding domain-containing protein n=1 Tax=Shewanella aestuarii TaxID=1028752 RepID=A0A6G9QH53_9GAMM|nr:hypothetical protein [Shewanella aestuarii]QIR13860.1 hypothetical protein HBH39_04555 [Shewanella aestuarii]
MNSERRSIGRLFLGYLIKVDMSVFSFLRRFSLIGLVIAPAVLSHTAENHAVLLGEFADNSIDVTDMQPMAVLKMLQQNSPQPLIFTYQQMSMSRSWFELAKIDNSCMYNKVKTPERQRLAYFSHYPITLYPPLRLIIRAEDADKFSDTFDISSITALQNKRFAVASNRAYGEVIDKQLAQKQDLIFFRDGSDSVDKLINMLEMNRIDGFIEYADAVSARLKSTRKQFEFKGIAIQGVQKPSPGYMVCTKTPTGKHLISTIDKAMSSKDFQRGLLDVHREFASVDDKSLLESELKAIFNL